MYQSILSKKKIGLSIVLGLLVSLWVQPIAANDKLQFLATQSNNWTMFGGDYSNKRYSQLDQVTPENVSELNVKFTLQLGSLRAQESVPVVIGNMMYVTSSHGPRYVFALDAATGEIIWKFTPEIPPDIEPTVCCDLGNRGIGYGEGKVVFGTLDARLIALDSMTGKKLWETKVEDFTAGIAITSPPLIVKNLAIIGYAGGEYGVRGALQSYDLTTGKQVWKTYSIPAPNEPGGDTWKGDSYKRGGGNMWYVGSYDPALNLVYYGTSNASPWDGAIRGPDSSNYGKFVNSGSASTLAFNADTGKKVWEYQSTPHDVWDYDGVSELVLEDMKIDGKMRKVAMKADRNGFFYVIDREDGELISADKFVYVNWAKKIDMETGRPVEDPAKRPTRNHKAENICPHLVGAKNWQPMAYNPKTKLAYFSTNNLCMTLKGAKQEYKRGQWWLGKEFGGFLEGPGGFGGEFVAWDPINRRRAWTIKSDLPYGGGAMTTASGLVFHGDGSGYFKALDANNGRQLWKFNAGSGILTGAMTYTVNGNQYVAIVVGKNTTMPNFMGDRGAKYIARTTEGGTLFVFGL